MFKENQESDYLFPSSSARLSQIEVAAHWNQTVQAAIEVASTIDPYQSSLPEGTVIPAIDAVNWSLLGRNDDLRPRLLDKATGEARLIDSGAMISAAKKLPGDKKSESISLVAVNGSRIDTYGIRNLEFKIGRKTYTIAAVICDIKEEAKRIAEKWY